MIHRHPFFMVIVLVLIAGCSKEETSPTGGGPADPLSGYGLRLNTTYARDLSGNFHSASATFSNAQGETMAMDSLTFNDIELTEPIGGHFYLTPFESSINVTGEDAHWYVHIADGLPTIQCTFLADPYPAIGDLTSATTIPNNQPYSLHFNTVQDADTVWITLGNVHRAFVGSHTTYDLPLSDMAQLPVGTAYLSIQARRSQVEVISGVRVWSTKSYILTRAVTITG